MNGTNLNGNSDDQPAARLRGAMVDRLAAAGVLDDPKWREAFLAVPRHRFVPAFFQPVSGGGFRAVSDETDPDQWLGEVYSDEPLVTQLDGHLNAEAACPTAKTVYGTATCSSSQPSLVALMLHHLDVRDGAIVLEIGSGTGETGGRLCERLGASNVTSIEVDADLAATAAKHLDGLGYAPTLIIGDGGDGWPAGAPYDRLIATCGFPAVPVAWLTQVTPGGRIVVNLYRPLSAGVLAVLDVRGDGSASGHFARTWAGFMPTRSFQDHGAVKLYESVDRDAIGDGRDTAIGPDALDGGRDAGKSGFRLLASLTVPVHLMTVTPEDGPAEDWLLCDDGSYARHIAGRVAEGGPRKLWTELEAAHQTWTTLGRPGREAFGLTVGPDGNHILWHGDEHGWSVPIGASS